MTDAERKLWWHLRRLPIEHSHFRRQATIGPDFACHEWRLVIEVDGAQHNEPENVARDAERSAYLRSQGYRILRFWNNDVLNINSVMEAILTAMHQNGASPPPLPPPHRAKMRGGRGTERPSRAANPSTASHAGKANR